MSQKNKLELTWIGKEHRPKLEPRILLEEADKSYHAAHRVTDRDLFDNRLIHGDNLLALKALEQDFAGKVKCIFIDPPYNTGSAFQHYDDGVEHSLWLSLMRDRIEIMRRLLSDGGSLWITIDDNEAHYLKVLCDEIFGRINFISNVVWEKKSASQANASWLSASHDHVLVFAKDKSKTVFNKLQRTDEQNSIYRSSDEFDGIDSTGKWYGRGPWYPDNFTLSLASGQRGKQFAKTGQSDNIYPIVTPSGREVLPSQGRAWSYTKESLQRLLKENRIWFGKNGDNKPTLKRFLSEVQDRGVVPTTSWHYSDVGENRIAAQEMKALFPSDPFTTPKPERLLERIVHLATNPGDLVLDSFLGSGTTAAVAHKMGRRWIGIELGEHCHTHCLPRLKKVVDGADPGGITEAVGWKGGGGFRYYRLAPSLLLRDKWDQLVINPEFNAPMLAEAVCKLEGFTYAPSDTLYWQQGHSNEQDFLYTTTANLSHDQLQQLSDEVGPDRSLLVVCSAFRGRKEGYSNLTVKKIPKAVLTRCEWGKDDYSLKVENLPKAPPQMGQQELF
jgi:adenine-specific DNA-methyltransferase